MEQLQASRVSELKYDEQMRAVAPPESQFSLNWQMIDGFGGNVQVTMRAALIGEWPEIMRERAMFCEKAQHAGWTFPGKVAPAPTAAAPKTNGNGAPVAAPAALQPAVMPLKAEMSNHAEMTFQADTLVGSLYEGKPSWKVKGGRFQQWGVTIWPEAIEASGLAVETGQTYSLAGYTAYYVSKPDGKPQKVVRLVAPAAA